MIAPSAPLADLILTIHFAIILFNLFGLIAPPLGAWLGWGFVRVAWWRALHLASLLVVAAQAVLGRACFLTIWQVGLEGGAGERARPLILIWVNEVMYWDLPAWVFVVIYLAVLAYALLLWRWVRPGPVRRLTS